MQDANQYLIAPIAIYLSERTNYLSNLRDSLPSGVEHFQFFNKGQVANWYEFFNQMAEEGPEHARLQTTFGSYRCQEPNMNWVKEYDGSEVFKGDKIILEALQGFTDSCKMLRLYDRWKELKK